MRIDLRWKIGLVSLLTIAVTGLGERWIENIRLASPLERAGETIGVVNGKDDGPGSLRFAIFAVARARNRVRIELRTSEIRLKRPLPPILGTAGVVIESIGGRCLINGSGQTGPILDIVVPDSILRGFDIRGGSGPSVMARASNLTIRDLHVSDSSEGVRIEDGTRGVEVSDSKFKSNGIGVSIAAGASRVLVRNNSFQQHTRAAVWYVRPTRQILGGGSNLKIVGNRFEEDRIGIVVINGSPIIESNESISARETAIYVVGGEPVVSGNLIRRGWMGIFVDGAVGGRLEDNELNEVQAVSLLVRGGENTLVRNNRLHRNTYGIASVFSDDSSPQRIVENIVLASSVDGFYILGGSPDLIQNRSLGSGAAGVRLVDYITMKGPILTASPQLRENVVEGNAGGEIVRESYRESGPDGVDE